MTNPKCDNCGIGEVISKDVPNYRTRLGGREITVPIAHLRVCNNCGAIYTPGKELKRWHGLLATQLPVESPISTQIRSLRERLGMNVSGFAQLFGVTRQSVYSWEDEAQNISPIRPIALLLLMISESLEKGPLDPLHFLNRAQFGVQSVAVVRHNRSSCFLPVDRYEHALGISHGTSPKSLPGLY